MVRPRSPLRPLLKSTQCLLHISPNKQTNLLSVGEETFCRTHSDGTPSNQTMHLPTEKPENQDKTFEDHDTLVNHLFYYRQMAYLLSALFPHKD